MFWRHAPVLALVVALGSFFYPSSALAQTPAIGELSSASAAAAAPESRREQAKLHFDRGLVLARAGLDWDAALAEFLASRELYPTRSATRNAAVALRELRRAAESLDYYSLLLREFSTSMPAEELAGIRSEMSALESSVGRVEIQSSEPGARVVVNGRYRGTTPLPEVLWLDAGTHTLRLSKEDFETLELTLSVAGGQNRTLKPHLERLRARGTLVVREANGRQLDVVINSAVVGRTPWTGNVAPGTHSVFLRGNSALGTAPSSAEVKVDQSTNLTLRAVPLQASILVDPTPSSATVYVDGVSVGSGTWQGRLPAGRHRIEVTSPGHLPFSRELSIRADESQVLPAQLDRDLSSPLWVDGPRPHPYAEVVLGALLSSSLRGGADQACNCDERTRPLGGLVAGRLGYALVGGLGVELTAGYLSISEELTRSVQTTRERVWLSTNYGDTTTLRGPFAAVTASYRLLDKTPITARVGFGLASLTSRTANSATFRGNLSNPSLEETRAYESRVSITEMDQRLLTPFGSTEIRFGYRISKRLSVDLGLGLLLMIPPREPRVGANNLSGDDDRATLLDDQNATWSDGTPVAPGQLFLPREAVAGAFVALSPSLGVRAEF